MKLRCSVWTPPGCSPPCPRDWSCWDRSRRSRWSCRWMATAWSAWPRRSPGGRTRACWSATAVSEWPTPATWCRGWQLRGAAGRRIGAPCLPSPGGGRARGLRATRPAPRLDGGRVAGAAPCLGRPGNAAGPTRLDRRLRVAPQGYGRMRSRSCGRRRNRAGVTFPSPTAERALERATELEPDAVHVVALRDGTVASVRPEGLHDVGGERPHRLDRS